MFLKFILAVPSSFFNEATRKVHVTYAACVCGVHAVCKVSGSGLTVGVEAQDTISTCALPGPHLPQGTRQPLQGPGSLSRS